MAWSVNNCTIRAMASSCTATSASRNKRMSPEACSAPMLRARAGPFRSAQRTTLAPSAPAFSAVLSLEPSSTTMHSRTSRLDRAMAPRHSSNVPEAL